MWWRTNSGGFRISQRGWANYRGRSTNLFFGKAWKWKKFDQVRVPGSPLDPPMEKAIKFKTMLFEYSSIKYFEGLYKETGRFEVWNCNCNTSGPLRPIHTERNFPLVFVIFLWYFCVCFQFYSVEFEGLACRGCAPPVKFVNVFQSHAVFGKNLVK